MDIVDEVFLWSAIGIAFTILLSVFIPDFLRFLTGGDIDRQTGLKKRFFWWDR